MVLGSLVGAVAAKVIGVALASVPGVKIFRSVIGVLTGTALVFVVGEVAEFPNSSLLAGDPGALESKGGVLDCGWPGFNDAGSEGGGGGVAIASAITSKRGVISKFVHRTITEVGWKTMKMGETSKIVESVTYLQQNPIPTRVPRPGRPPWRVTG